MDKNPLLSSMSKVISFPVKYMGEDVKPKRKRSMTSVALNWLSERMRRADELKQAVASGTYKVPTDRVAKALVNTEEDQPIS